MAKSRSMPSLPILALLMLLALPETLRAKGEPAPLFASTQPLEVVLTLPMRQLRAQKRQRERIYLEGQWAYRDEQGELVRLSVKARARGKSRLDFCYYPPVRLNFLKKQVKNTLFHGQDKLKLVNPCNKGSRYEQLVMLEYLAYRLLLTLTDQGFFVRPLEIHFVDSQEKDKPRTGFGFLIESDDEMAARIGGPVYEGNSVGPTSVHQEATALAELFQYLIGNNDYSLIRSTAGEMCCHNARLVGRKEAGQMVPVPYDFDMSGLVNAPYAAPPESLPIRSVRQRHFRGICREEGAWRAAIARFNERREALYGEVASLTRLEERPREQTIEYLDRFYETINDEKKLNREILDRCRG